MLVREEQYYLAEQDRIGYASLPPALLALENVADYNGGVYAVEQRRRSFPIKPDVGNARHTAETHIGVKDLPELIALAVFIENPPSCPAEFALALPHLKAVEVQKLAERGGETF